MTHPLILLSKPDFLEKGKSLRRRNSKSIERCRRDISNDSAIGVMSTVIKRFRFEKQYPSRAAMSKNATPHEECFCGSLNRSQNKFPKLHSIEHFPSQIGATQYTVSRLPSRKNKPDLMAKLIGK